MQKKNTNKQQFDAQGTYSIHFSNKRICIKHLKFLPTIDLSLETKYTSLNASYTNVLMPKYTHSASILKTKNPYINMLTLPMNILTKPREKKYCTYNPVKVVYLNPFPLHTIHPI